jgi:hypothetical protein
LTTEIEKSIAKKGSVGLFAIPGLCKIVVKNKPALPRRHVPSSRGRWRLRTSPRT